MSSTDLLMAVCDGGRRYLAPRAHVDQIRLFDGAALPAEDDRGRPLVGRALSDLLGLDPSPAARRRHVLLVALRRRSVAILVERIEALESAGDLAQQPLAPLLLRALARPWFLGAAIYADEPTLVLDLRQIAMDVISGGLPTGSTNASHATTP